MRVNLWLIITTVALVGCGAIEKRAKSPKYLSLTSDWTVSTLQTSYMGYRRFHPMQPVLWRDSVIVGNTIDGLVSRDQVSGGKIWQRRFKGGVGIGVAVEDGVLFVGTGEGQFMALSVSTGETKWSYPIRSEGVGSPLVADGRVYFISGDHILYALDAETGRKLWTYNRQVRSAASVFGAGRPVINGKKIFAGFADGHFVALDKSNGGLLWDITLKSDGRFRDVDSSPVISGNRIYTASFDGALYALDFSGNIVWRNDGGTAGDILIGEDKIYYSTSDGRIMGLDRKSGKVLWQKDLKNGYGTGPILYKNLLLVGETSGDLLALNPEKGQTVAQFSPGHGVTSSATVAPSGRIFFSSLGANLFSVKMEWRETLREWPWEKSIQ